MKICLYVLKILYFYIFKIPKPWPDYGQGIYGIEKKKSIKILMFIIKKSIYNESQQKKNNTI